MRCLPPRAAGVSRCLPPLALLAAAAAAAAAEVLAFLPVAAVIDGSILVIHGGISGRFDLDKLNAVPRSHYKTLQDVPPEVGQRAEGGHHPHEPNAVVAGGNTCVVRDGFARVRLPSGTWRKPVTKEEKSEAVGGRSRGGGSSHAHRCVPAARLQL